MLLILLQVVIIATSSSGISLNKCCPIDEAVSMDAFEDNLLSLSDLFKCIPLNNQTVQEEKINFSHQFLGYNTLVDHESHWPSCGEETLSYKLLNEPMKSSQSTSCVDMIDDKYYVFTCGDKSENSEDSTDILKLKKCCPLGTAYDIFGRRCVENNATDVDSDFQEFLHKRKVVLFEYDEMKCKDDEALIEYHSVVHGLKIYEDALVLMKNVIDFGPVVIRSPFCIEATLNSEVDMPNGMKKDHFANRASSKFIAKACRERKVCNNIPCFQKCCPNGERMAHDGNKTSCEKHHSDIEMKFHSFNKEQSAIEPPAFEPMGEYSIYFITFERKISKKCFGSRTSSITRTHIEMQ